MTIRSRLLLLLLPTLTALVCLIALFFYFNWSREILSGFKSRLYSSVVGAAQTIKPEEIEWIQKGFQNPNTSDHPRYQEDRQNLVQLKQKLALNNLYIVQIEPVQEGQPVLQDQPASDFNPVYEGQDPSNAFRQIFILDTADKEHSSPGTYDFSETDERQVYFTKKALVTPIYKARKTQERFMSAYAPITDNQGEVIALLGADVSVKEIDDKLRNALLIILLGAFITILLVVLSVFLIANAISKPVQQLNQAALDIAAGDYEANIHVNGPKEIVELANTLNTMSECLVEHMSRLQESSLVRERMYGEYECARLLQHYMLQKVVEQFQHPYCELRFTSAPLSNQSKGLLLRANKEQMTDVHLTLIESKRPGFAALYELNQAALVPLPELKGYSYIDCHLKTKDFKFYYNCSEFPTPLFWSLDKQQFLRDHQQEIQLHPKDLVLIYNNGLAEQFESRDKLEFWVGKILRHFSNTGIVNIHTMLNHELNFLARKEHLKHHLQILSLQIKYPIISG